MHQSLFTARQDILKKQLEEILGRKINKMDAVMLAVLNFQKKFMQSNYSHVQVLLENQIAVDLKRTAPIPAAERLAQTQEGQARPRQMHQSLSTAGQDILKKQLEEILGRKINEMVTDLEPLSGKSTIVIRLEDTTGSVA